MVDFNEFDGNRIVTLLTWIQGFGARIIGLIPHMVFGMGYSQPAPYIMTRDVNIFNNKVFFLYSMNMHSTATKDMIFVVMSLLGSVPNIRTLLQTTRTFLPPQIK